MKLGYSPEALAEMERPVPGQPPRLDRDLTPGELLDQRFAIKAIICRGGMSTLYQAEDLKQDGRTVVLKVPTATFGMDSKQMPRFEREDEIARRVNHPLVMKFFPLNGERSRPYLAMEYLQGITLHHSLRETKILPEAQALKLAVEICVALEYLHEQGIFHRDLKPDNVMLCHDGTIRLMDFGISRFDESPRLTYFGFAPGTPHYMAPERVECKRGDARTDVYGVGAILYELLTGRLAFDGLDPMVMMNARAVGDPIAPRKHNPQISPQVEEIILKAMARDPDDRYQSAAEMRADLEAPSQVQVTNRAGQLRPATQFRRFLRKVRLLAPWIIIPVALQIVGFFVFMHFLSNRR